MNKKAFTDKDMLNLIKIAVATIVGYIVIKALIQASQS